MKHKAQGRNVATTWKTSHDFINKIAETTLGHFGLLMILNQPTKKGNTMLPNVEYFAYPRNI